MKICRFLLPLLITLVPMLSSARENRKEDGQYFCIVEHAAGLRWEDKEKSQPMFSGKIKLPDEDMKFFIKVGSVVNSDTSREICENDISYWFNQVFEKRIAYPDHSPENKHADDREWIGRNCFASDEIKWQSLNGNKGWVFRGYGNSEYHGTSTGQWFNLYGDSSFMMGFEYDSGPVVEYGHCSKIEPPK
jgi:hypothetical protein